MKLIDEIKKLTSHRYARQFSMLITANFAVAVISFISNWLITNHLTTDDYGVYRYATNFLQLGVSFITLGFPISVSRLLAQEDDEGRQRRLIGAAYVLFALTCLLGVIVTYAVYFGSRAVGYYKLHEILIIAPWFLYITVLEYGISNICSGTNNIKLLSSQSFLPVGLLTVFTALQIYVIMHYNIAQALVAFAIAHTVIIAIGIYRIKPSFKDIRVNLVCIWKENRTTGFPAYIGGVIGVSSVQIIGLSIMPLVSKTDYALYSNAYSISAPLAMVASTLGTVLFRSSADKVKLSSKVLIYSCAGCAAIALVYVLLIRDVVAILFRPEYLAAVPMAKVMGVGALMVGLGDILNRFLGANGRGKLLLIGSIITGVTAVASAVVLLPMLGAMGAALSRVAANVAYFAAMIALYRYRNNAVIKNIGDRR